MYSWSPRFSWFFILTWSPMCLPAWSLVSPMPCPGLLCAYLPMVSCAYLVCNAYLMLTWFPIPFSLVSCVSLVSMSLPCLHCFMWLYTYLVFYVPFLCLLCGLLAVAAWSPILIFLPSHLYMFPYGLLYLPGLLRLVLVSYTLFLYILCMQVSGYAKCQTQSPSQVRNLQVISVNATVIHVRWQRPVASGTTENKLSYNISLNGYVQKC